jgi:hypothetical protein
VDKGFNYAGGSSRNSGGVPPALMPRYDSYRGGPPAYSQPMGCGGPGGYGGNRPIHGGGGAPPPLSGYVPSHQETITTTTTQV